MIAPSSTELKMYLSSFVFFSASLTLTLCSLTTEYYSNLIANKRAEALIFQLPQSNEEFRAGANSDVTNDFGSYDFVIVGAGSAGSVLATRLSEIEDFKVLLLEAGGEEDDFSTIPAMFLHLQFDEINWGYYTTPQKNSCLGMVDQRCIVPRGKLIGGSSSTNAVMYVRGNPKDYDRWAEMGNPGWSYQEVLPYFIKSENSQIEGDDGYHGIGGFWNVEYSFPDFDLFQNFLNGSAEMNVPTLDYNGENQFGASPTQFNTKRGKRQSTGTAFLDNARKRKNLTVVTKALVTKILIDPDNRVAQGVEFVTSDQKFTVKATKEVIVSAGAINSPQLLMLSGIGPKEHLEELGIKVLADLPVGKNLLEHPMFPGLVFHTNYNPPTIILEDLIKQYLQGYGALARGGVNGIGFIKTEETEVPSIEYLFFPPLNDAIPILKRAYNYDEELTYDFLGRINPTSDITIDLVLLHEKSVGQVTLKSSDPIDFPNIDLNMFDRQEDVDTMIAGIKFVLEMAETEAFKNMGAELLNIPICSEFTNLSDDYWECVIRKMTSTLYHPCGTTSMGNDSSTSVVDNELKVHGIGGLRVVDAGVFPSTVSGHTNAPTVMAAEKIADRIKSDYNTKQ